MGISNKVYLAMAAMFVFGSGIPLFAKLIDLTLIDGKMFEHPYLQAAVMFVGDALSYIVYKLSGRRTKKEETLIPSQRREDSIYMKYGKKLFILPAFFFVLTSFLAYISVVLTAPSIYQILRGGNIIFVAIFSLIFLKRKFYKHQWLGLFFICLGLLIVGVVSIIYKAKTAKSPVLGIILVLFLCLFSAGYLVLEEKLMENIQINPLEVVGIEGITGLCVSIAILPILNLIPCSLESLCNDGYIENTVKAARVIFENTNIALYLFSMMICVLVFDTTGVYVTKNASAVARSIVISCRMVLIWIVSLILKWEELLIGEICGFGLLIMGSMIYNEIIVLRVWGLDTGVNEEKERKKNREEIQLREEITSSEST